MSCLGISEDTFYRTANSQHFKGEQWRQWTAQRAFVALYISAHRGHVDAVQYLLELGNSAESLTWSAWEDRMTSRYFSNGSLGPSLLTHQMCLLLGSWVLSTVWHAHQGPVLLSRSGL